MNTIAKKVLDAAETAIQMIDKNGVVIKEYESIKQASEQENIPIGDITPVLRGKKAQLWGIIWRYKK